MKPEVLVVGGGAAGMAAAYGAAMSGCAVTLLEKNEKLGKKVYITGKGRCNVTNACPEDELIKNVISNPRFLYSAFRFFSNEDLIFFLKENGCPVKTERGMRVFPVSDHASDVIRAFEQALHATGVSVQLNREVLGIRMEGNRILGADVGNKVRHETCFYPCDALILATGGLSYPATGSTGDGLSFAKELGHSVVDCIPSLVPLETKEDWPRSLSGLTLKNVSVTVLSRGKALCNEFGELLFTHFGISGPTILTISSKCGREIAESGSLQLSVDLKPALPAETLDRRLLREAEDQPRKQMKTILASMLPKALIPVIIREAGVNGDCPGSELTRADRCLLVQTMKHLVLTLTGTRGFAEAVVTKGGVSVSEINPSSMQSKLVPNLFFAGELVDVDALTGGFNLQIAWSTGMLAGSSAGSFCQKGEHK